MKIFKQLNKKGYKHYYGDTVEELDSMDKENQHLHSEIMQVIMWLYEKHGIWIEVTTNNNPQVRKEFVSFNARVIHRDRNIKFRVLMNTQINKYTEPFNSPTEAYKAAIEYVLNNLI